MNSFDPFAIKSFELVGYDFDAESGQVQLRYALLGDAQPVTFTEHIEIPVSNRDPQAIEVADRLARLLFLVAGTSYYKAAAPGIVSVAIPITNHEKRFLETVVRRGMTEFAYVNNMPQALTPTIETTVIIPAEPVALMDVNTNHPLVPVGGGKDSTVTFEALRQAGFSPTLFAVNSYGPINATVERSGLPYLEAKRHIDPNIRELNELGALNGHVPVTIINSVLALMTAVMNGMTSVVMSNERSASEGNVLWHGIDVNHQWAKSIVAEKLLQETLATVVSPSVTYFSLLRPFSELVIARKFATLEQYHDVFTSCNRAFYLDPSQRQIWCGECDKCRFVFLILAPYMSARQLEAVFRKNMLDDGDQLAGFRELLGIEGHKPLECVGEVAECRYALQLVSQKDDWKQAALVSVLLHDIPDVDMPTPEQQQDILAAGKHLVPEAYLPALEQIK